MKMYFNANMEKEIAMELLGYECPYEKMVFYDSEKDRFESLLIVKTKMEQYGVLEFEVELHKTYDKKSWRVGKLYCEGIKINKNDAAYVRKYIENDGFGLLTLLENEIQPEKQSHEEKEKIIVKKIESMYEKFNKYECGRYKEQFRIQLFPQNKFYNVFLNKKHNKIAIDITRKEMATEDIGNPWYHGWRKEVEDIILEYWLNKESKVSRDQKEKWLKKINKQV